MASSISVRRARAEDAAEMARVHVRSWQETYRGLLPDEVLDRPGFIDAREQFWTAALTAERYSQNRVAVAQRDSELIGIAMSGPPEDAAAPWTTQLYVLYVLAAEQGSGAGASLLNAVIESTESVALWVADPNPRAQSFYAKHRFIADGTSKLDGELRAIRMIRGRRSSSTRGNAPEYGEDMGRFPRLSEG